MQVNGNLKIKATFLGTGTSQGVPVVACDCNVCISTDLKDQRLRSAVLLQVNGQNIVIDAGPDFRQQMLKEKIKTLRAILITHEHVDHIFGLDDIRSFNWIQKHPTDIFAEKRVQDSIKRIFDYVFSDSSYPGIPKMELHLLKNEPFMIDETEFIPVRCYHHKLPVFGFRVGDFSYITDTNFIAPDEVNKLMGSRVLVINALRREKHISHFNLEQALEVIHRVNPEKAFLTHISHGFGRHHEIQSWLPENVFAAYDGQSISIDDEVSVLS